MKRVWLWTLVVVLVAMQPAPAGSSAIRRGGPWAADGAKPVAGEEVKPRIQIAILLDTSGSMSGLIEQAKTQIWKIVNEFATTKKDGKIPELQVALYEYGKSSLPASEGYLRMIVPLSTDLDKVSEELFTLRTNGGQEYCGWVIKCASEELAWSKSYEDLKAIFIAGNEPFTQGKIDYRKACKAAIEKGIIVNTIHCGDHGTGIRTNWKDGALLADGAYMSINQNRQVVHVNAPQDKRIARLGVELNKTYVPYGALGKAGAARQVAADSSARGSAPTGAFVQRMAAKASVQYRNVHWDLVDAVREGKVRIEELKEKDLPAEMRKMSMSERKAYVVAKTKERKKAQAEINRLNAERKKFVAKEMKKISKPKDNTLDAVMIETIRKQASKKNFKSQ